MAKKARRIKSDNNALQEFSDLSQVDLAIRKIGDLQLSIRQAENLAKEKIDEAKAELAETVKPFQDRIKLLNKSIEGYATNGRRRLFGKRQSITLGFGAIGWRKSAVISVTKATLEKLKAVFGKKAGPFIHTKETVNKEALAKLTDDKLAEVGARRKHKEVFFVEPDLTEAVDY